MSLLRTMLHLLIAISIAMLPLAAQSALIRCGHGAAPVSALSQPCRHDALAHLMDADANHTQTSVSMERGVQGCKNHCPTCGLCQCGCATGPGPGAGIVPSNYHAISDRVARYEHGRDTKIHNRTLPPPIPPPI